MWKKEIQVENNMRKMILFPLSYFMSRFPKAEPVNGEVTIGSGIHIRNPRAYTLKVLTLMAHQASISHLHLCIG